MTVRDVKYHGAICYQMYCSPCNYLPCTPAPCCAATGNLDCSVPPVDELLPTNLEVLEASSSDLAFAASTNSANGSDMTSGSFRDNLLSGFKYFRFVRDETSCRLFQLISQHGYEDFYAFLLGAPFLVQGFSLAVFTLFCRLRAAFCALFLCASSFLGENIPSAVVVLRVAAHRRRAVVSFSLSLLLRGSLTARSVK